MLPFGVAVVHRDVSNRTQLGAESATYAALVVQLELLVANYPSHEYCPNHSAVDARPSAHCNVAHPASSLFDVIDEGVEQFCCCLLLVLLFFGLVDVHKGQTDIRLRHYKRHGAISLQPFFRQLLLEYVHCLPDIVSSCADYEVVSWFVAIETYAAYEFYYDKRRSPTMDRKEKAKCLVLANFVLNRLIAWMVLHLGCNVNGVIINGGCCGSGSPFGVARTGEIEYHVLLGLRV